ncbi:hypothetical protein C8R44DRAFT_731437 [Mycena epipterygia]|nr:hypothetical protein C8R44DRAFT_731437 [Mycena epipterygia]
MPRAPRFNHGSQEEQYTGSDSRTWNATATPPYSQFGPPQGTGTNFGQMAANQHNFQMAQLSGQMPPPPSIPRHAAPVTPGYYQNHSQRPAPPRAPTQVDSRPPDYWHNDKHLRRINRGSEAEYPVSISFRPSHGPCTGGVALLNLELGRGLLAPHDRIDGILPPFAARFANAAMLIDWPGYCQVSFILTLIDPPTRRYITRAQLGAQVTQHFKDFLNSRKDEDFFDDTPGGAFLLGNDGVVYDQVRLVELYTKDGMTWRPEFALNAHFLSV